MCPNGGFAVTILAEIDLNGRVAVAVVIFVAGSRVKVEKLHHHILGAPLI